MILNACLLKTTVFHVKNRVNFARSVLGAGICTNLVFSISAILFVIMRALVSELSLRGGLTFIHDLGAEAIISPPLFLVLSIFTSPPFFGYLVILRIRFAHCSAISAFVARSLVKCCFLFCSIFTVL